MLKYVTVQKRESGTSEKDSSIIQETKGLVFREKKGDLFSADDRTSLVHCVSVDLHMGKGIAVLFKKKFGGVQNLRAQNKKVGEVAVLKSGSRFIYYLTTKERYFNKPTYATLQSSLEQMRSHCAEHGVRQLAMPQIGCGLDRLAWERVSEMIQDIFKEMDMEITVYYL